MQVGKYYYPVMGGIETVLQNLSEGLVSRGEEVTVICSHTEAKRIYEERRGVEVIKLPTFGAFASQPLTPSLWSEMRLKSGHFDLFHIHSPNPLAEVSCIALTKSPPIVITYHSDIIRQKFLGSMYKPALRKFLHKVDRIVVGSDEALENSPILPEFRDKCVVIPFGISDSAFKRGEQVDRRASEMRIRYGDFMLFTGRLVSYKGLEILLQAMKNINNQLVVVGDGPLRRPLQELADSLGISERVHFTGFVEDSVEFAAYYHACEVFVLPSITRAEAFGMVLLEAMACSKPVISTRLDSGVAFVNQDGVSGLQVAPGSVRELEEAIAKLFSAAELRQEMGKQARLRFEEHFTLEKMISSYQQLYRELVS